MSNSRPYGLNHHEPHRFRITPGRSPSLMDNSPTIAILTVDAPLDEIKRLASLIALERRLNHQEPFQVYQQTSATSTLQPLSFTTTSSFAPIYLPDLPRPRRSTPLAKVRALASFTPEPMPSRFAVILKLHWLGLDVRSLPRAFRTSPSSRTMRRGADSSWRSVLRHASGTRQ